jgi:RNA polymerase sigma-70 factor (sigma-E family)
MRTDEGKGDGMADDSSFEQFATAAAGVLLRTAWLLTADKHAAEDLVQETLARVYVRWSGRTPIENPVGYARTVLVRQFISGRRRRSSTEVVTDVLPETGVLSDQVAHIALRTAIAGMDPKDRAVLVLRYFADRTVAETAADLGLTESAVRTRTSRAVDRLRTRLGDDFLTTTN